MKIATHSIKQKPHGSFVNRLSPMITRLIMPIYWEQGQGVRYDALTKCHARRRFSHLREGLINLRFSCLKTEVPDVHHFSSP